MKVLTIGWISVFIAIFIMNIYIWQSYWKIPFRKSRLLKAGSYLIVHISLTVVSVYYFYLFFSGQTGTRQANILSYVAGFYLTFLHYSILMYLLHDLVYLTRNIIPYTDKMRIYSQKIFFGGFLIFGIAAVISILSLINASRLKTTEYSIGLDGRNTSLENLNVVYISDAHIGTSVNLNNIDEIIDEANSLNPDIVFLGGDFFDEGTTEEEKLVSSDKLSQMKSKYGIYAVEGNHEYKSGDCNIDKQMKYFSEAGIRVLQDEVVKIEDDFYIIGRKDRHGEMKALSELGNKISENLPIIVLDHRPSYKELADNYISLQISGHTHSGQFFPSQIFNRIAGRLSKQYIYGHHEIDGVQHIVSSGVGNWGIPVRIGSRREIVSIKLNFK